MCRGGQGPVHDQGAPRTGRSGSGFDETDAVDVLRALTREDSVGRIRSRQTDEWMYVFKPSMAATVVYVKVILRGDCVVISFHEDWDEQKENGNDQDR